MSCEKQSKLKLYSKYILRIPIINACRTYISLKYEIHQI